MKKKFNPEDLKIGMYVELPDKWINHPFFKNEFKITSHEQIQKFINSDIERVVIDMKKSDIRSSPEQKNEDNSQHAKDTETDKDKTEEKYSEKEKKEKKDGCTSLLPQDFAEKINDESIEPKKRAKYVYSSSLNIMEDLLDNPTSENIHEFKEGTAEIVKFILKNDAITSYLLNITDYDYYTYTHSVNVGIYSILLAKSLFGDSDYHDMKELGAGFFLHDIGKVRIDPDILNKKGNLTDREFAIIKTHTTQGYKVLIETEQLTEESKIIVLQHHERYDGSGYPDGLSGDEIHLYSKICCIADVFDALTSRRPYRDPITPYKALKLMKEEMLNHFQEEIFREFVLLFKKT